MRRNQVSSQAAVSTATPSLLRKVRASAASRFFIRRRALLCAEINESNQARIQDLVQEQEQQQLPTNSSRRSRSSNSKSNSYPATAEAKQTQKQKQKQKQSKVLEVTF
jgi:hypothetical protein